MNIKCPKCNKTTSIEAQDISCSHCKHSFHGSKLAKKALLPTSLALILGAVAATKIENTFEENRYPHEIEYALIEACVSGKKGVFYTSKSTEKFKICVCALKGAQEEVAYSDLEEKIPQFTSAMQESISSCQ